MIHIWAIKKSDRRKKAYGEKVSINRGFKKSFLDQKPRIKTYRFLYTCARDIPSEQILRQQILYNIKHPFTLGINPTEFTVGVNPTVVEKIPGY